MHDQIARILAVFVAVLTVATHVNAFDVFQDGLGNVYIVALESQEIDIYATRLTIANQPLQVRVATDFTSGQPTLDFYEFFETRSVTILGGLGVRDISVAGPIQGDVSIFSEASDGRIWSYGEIAGDLSVAADNGGMISLFSEVLGNTSIDGGDNAANINIKNATFEGDLSIVTGSDRDSIYIGETTTSTVPYNEYANNQFFGSTTISTNGHADVIHFNQAEFFGPLQIHTGPGDDLILGGERNFVPIGYLLAHDRVLIETGGNKDEVTFTTCDFGDSFTLRTGNHSDRVKLGESSFDGDTYIDMGGYDDTLLVQQATFAAYSMLDGGKGNADVGRKSVGLVSKNFFTRNFEIGNLK